MFDPFDGNHRVDPDNPLPRHTQVQNIVRTLVATGRLSPGDKIPAEVDVAKALGVSKMTVNKALLALQNEGLLVREVGRGTFIADAVPLGIITPSRNGRHTGIPRVALTFARGERDILGNDYYGPLHQGIAEFFELGSEAPKAQLVLGPLTASDYQAEDEQHPADARIIVAPREDDIASINALGEQGKHLVVIGASWPGMAYSCVDSDNVAGAQSAIEHLTQRGHRRIALIYAEPNTANIQDRRRGYQQGLLAAGCELDSALEITAEKSWKLGADAMVALQTLLTGPEPVTAIFAAGYYLALEALSMAHELRLEVPRDLSVVGFDDPMGAQLTYPPLTTMRQPLQEMGYRAAQRLANLMNGSSQETTHDVLAPTLTLRRSTSFARTKQTFL